jgi:ureidoacrylate peracid hydrolase
MAEQDTSDPNFAEILSPESAAVLVVDVQNDFCHERGAIGRLGFDMGAVQSSVRALEQFLKTARQAQVPVIFIVTQHSEWTNSKAWLTRGPRRGGEISGVRTWGAELYQLAPTPGEPVIIKHRYSGFVGTDLDTILRSRERRSLLVTGVSTNVCVESTARDACMRDYHVVLVDDCCGALTLAEHEAALHNMRNYFGRVLNSRAIAAHWRCLETKQTVRENESVREASKVPTPKLI